MPTEAVDLGVTDEDLFKEANADEPADEAIVDPPEAEPEPGQPRDEAGRFAEKVEAPALTATDPPAPPPVDDNAAMVPSWRVREINEEKRTLADKLAALEAERLNWQRQPAPQPQPAPKAEEPDPLLDPKGFRDFVREETRQEILNDRREASLANAHRTYKGEFEEAYAAAQKQVDPVLKMKMQNSRDPGETLIEWHRENKTRAEVGNDPNVFFEKRLEAWLADPANQAKVIERARSGAQPQPGNGKQPAPVNLPPSLTRAASAATIDADDDDVSDDGLWKHANA